MSALDEKFPNAARVFDEEREAGRIAALEKWIAWMRENGVRRLVVDGFEIELHPPR